MTELKRWYFVTSREGSTTMAPEIRAAVSSAKLNTRLEPVCIHAGLDPDTRAFLVENGVELHELQVPFVDRMEAEIAPFEAFNRTICSGTYLKCFISLIEQRDELVLYTDIDVVFQRHPKSPEAVRFLAACPEYDLHNWAYFNTGIMVLNVPNMRRVHTEIMAYIDMRMRTKIWCSYEQGDYNAFFWMRWNHMQPEANWKPYWGANDHAEIIHWHGPKPRDVDRWLRHGPEGMDPYTAKVVAGTPEAYAHYSRVFRQFGHVPDVDEAWSLYQARLQRPAA